MQIQWWALSARVLRGSDNTAGRDSALLAVRGAAANNTGLVYQVGTGVTTGIDSTTIGYQAGKNITTGMSNVVVGEVGNVTTGNLTASSDADLKLRHLVNHGAQSSETWGSLLGIALAPMPPGSHASSDSAPCLAISDTFL